jgi:hypothetical protein
MRQSSLSAIFSGVVPAEFKSRLKAGTFVKKNDLSPGNLAEIVYEGNRKYIFILNELWMRHKPERTFSPKPVPYIHAINLAHITQQDFMDLLRLTTNKNPESAYASLETLAARTRSYRTYLHGKVKRVRALQYIQSEKHSL